MKLSLVLFAASLLIGCQQIPEVRSYPKPNFWTYKTVEVKQDNSAEKLPTDQEIEKFWKDRGEEQRLEEARKAAFDKKLCHVYLKRCVDNNCDEIELPNGFCR